MTSENCTLPCQRRAASLTKPYFQSDKHTEVALHWIHQTAKLQCLSNSESAKDAKRVSLSCASSNVCQPCTEEFPVQSLAEYFFLPNFWSLLGSHSSDADSALMHTVMALTHSALCSQCICATPDCSIAFGQSASSLELEHEMHRERGAQWKRRRGGGGGGGVRGDGGGKGQSHHT